MHWEWVWILLSLWLFVNQTCWKVGVHWCIDVIHLMYSTYAYQSNLSSKPHFKHWQDPISKYHVHMMHMYTFWMVLDYMFLWNHGEARAIYERQLHCPPKPNKALTHYGYEIVETTSYSDRCMSYDVLCIPAPVTRHFFQWDLRHFRCLPSNGWRLSPSNSTKLVDTAATQRLSRNRPLRMKSLSSPPPEALFLQSKNVIISSNTTVWSAVAHLQYILHTCSIKTNVSSFTTDFSMACITGQINQRQDLWQPRTSAWLVSYDDVWFTLI